MGKYDENEPSKLRQFLAAFIVSLSALSAGMCLSWTSAAIPMLQQEDSVPRITDDQGAWIGSLITLGAYAGAIPTGVIVNILGRRLTLQLLVIPMCFSWIVIAYCGNVIGMYLARFLAGICVGGITVAVPMYLSELSHISIRGTLGTFFQLQMVVGLLTEYILGAVIENFQTLAIYSSILPIVFIVVVMFVPESPVHLCNKNNTESARKSLKTLRGKNYNVEDELQDILNGIKQAAGQEAKLSDLFKSKPATRALIISLGLMLFQQLSGINAVIFYAGKVFSETGTNISPNLCAILVGVVLVVSSLISLIVMDKAGRKTLLLASDIVMTLSLISLGLYLHFRQTIDLSEYSFVPLVSVFVFIILFSIGFGPIPWLIMGEIFPPQFKGIASSLSAAFNWILAFIVTNQFQNINNLFGVGITFILFSVICIFGTIFVAYGVPETKGIPIDEMQEILQNNKRRNRRNCTNVANTTV